MTKTRFEWDAYAFADLRRVIAEDSAHSEAELRYFCFGEVNGGILTVGHLSERRNSNHRQGKAIYERENQVHR